MDKEEFDRLIKNIPEHLEKRKKEVEEYDFYGTFDEDSDVQTFMYWKNVYTLTTKGYLIFEKLWDSGTLTTNKDGYLCVKDNDRNKLIEIHRYLKLKEIEQLAKKLNCEDSDIHVHHINKDKFDNREENLEVLHKDHHAQRHGFLSWSEYQRYRKDKIF